jgi:8-oxo-dGTP pyrophosphatase MutT (NUDIX family)
MTGCWPRGLAERGWWLPAGHVDPNESFATAALRETVEEAGIHVNLVSQPRPSSEPYLGRPSDMPCVGGPYATCRRVSCVWSMS